MVSDEEQVYGCLGGEFAKSSLELFASTNGVTSHRLQFRSKYFRMPVEETETTRDVNEAADLNL
jgi:hypothetical protein